MGCSVLGSKSKAGEYLDHLRFYKLLKPVQTGPETYPASCTMGTVSFLVVKQLRCGVDHPSHLLLRLKKGRALPLLPLWAFVACSRVNFTFLYKLLKKDCLKEFLFS